MNVVLSREDLETLFRAGVEAAKAGLPFPQGRYMIGRFECLVSEMAAASAVIDEAIRDAVSEERDACADYYHNSQY